MKKTIIVLILMLFMMLCGICWGDAVEMKSTRPGSALVNNATFAENSKILQSWSICSPALYNSDTDYYPVDVDNSRSVILAFDITGSTSSFNFEATALYTINSSGTATKIADVTDSTFTVTEEGGEFDTVQFTSVVVLSNGRYLLCGRRTASAVAQDATVCKSKLFYSDDGGTTWSDTSWTQPDNADKDGDGTSEVYKVNDVSKQGLPFGDAVQWGWVDCRDTQYLVINEYGNKLAASGAQALGLYISNDYGSTWEWIYRVPQRDRRHTHISVYEPGSNRTAIWVSTGDNDGTAPYDAGNTQIMRIELSGGSWSYDTSVGLDRGWQPTAAIVKYPYIYYGSDGSAFTIGKLDVTTQKLFNTETPIHDEYGSSNIYESRNSGGLCFDIKRVNGKYYACINGSGREGVGVWVSSDLEKWTPFIRNADTIENAFVAGCLDNKIYISSFETGELGTRQGIVVDEPTVTNISYTSSFPELKNVMSDAGHDVFSYSNISSFLADFSISTTPASEATLQTTGGLFGGKSVKLNLTASGTLSRHTFPRINDIDPTITFQTGDIITYVVWIKPGDSLDKDTRINLANARAAVPGITIGSLGGNTVNVLSDGYMAYIVSYYINDDTDVGDGINTEIIPQLQITFADYQNDSVVIGATALYVQSGNTARNWSGKPPFIEDTVNKEVLACDLAGIGDEWTVIFSVKPEFAEQNFSGKSDIILPIAQINDLSSNNLKLYWSNDSTSGSAIYITDGVDTVGGTTDYSPYLNDLIHIAIVGSKGSYSKAYIFDPVNFETGEITLGSGANLDLPDVPVSLLLGVNGTDVGYSNFASVRSYDSIKTVTQIKTELESFPIYTEPATTDSLGVFYNGYFK